MSDLRSAFEFVINKSAEVLLRNAGDELLQACQELAADRVGSMSGTYHSSFRLIEERFRVQVVNDAEYSGIIEAGSAPHEIRPRSGRALRIEPPIQVGNRRVTALSKVNHPGTQAQWVLRDALRTTVRRQFG